MKHRLRAAGLVLALALAAPAAAHAADVPPATEFRVPKPLLDWARKNAAALYIIFDEIMDDLTGCDCPPTAPAPPPPPPDTPPW